MKRLSCARGPAGRRAAGGGLLCEASRTFCIRARGMPMSGIVSGLRIPVAGRGVHDYAGQPFSYVKLTGIRDLGRNARARW